MKIENGYNQYLQNIKQTQKHSVNKKNTHRTEKPVEKNVEVNISEEAKRLSEISQKEARSERVAQIKAAVNNGTYQINTKEITEGIMREIGRQKGIDE